MRESEGEKESVRERESVKERETKSDKILILRRCPGVVVVALVGKSTPSQLLLNCHWDEERWHWPSASNERYS